MRAFVVVNPVAGGGRTRRLWCGLRDLFRRLGLEFEFEETTEPGAATGLARRAIRDRWSVVVAVGGDGTVNEVVNGLTDSTGRPLGTLGVIATGRGRDVCRNLGVASDPEESVRRLVEGEETLVDLGVAEWEGRGRRYFINAAGVGFDAVVAERAQAGRGAGTLSYVLAVLGALRAHRPFPAEIHLDGRSVWRGPMAVAVVGNGSHYGGGMKIAPTANPSDGSLDLIVVGDFGRIELLRWLPTVYRGAHLANPKVATHRGRSVSIRATTRVPMHLDGERVGHTPVSLSVCPNALRLRR